MSQSSTISLPSAAIDPPEHAPAIEHLVAHRPVAQRHVDDRNMEDRVGGAERTNSSDTSLRVAAVIGVLFSGAIFGFFYAWVCSTMWGLDSIDPRVAITAMNGMNASVRNFAFAPAFFGTAPVLAIVAGFAWSRGRRSMATWFAAAAVIYLLGAVIVTMAINVPMNRELLDTVVPTDRAAAEQIWTDYSSRWQRWNITRTVFSGIALACAAIGTTKVTSRRA